MEKEHEMMFAGSFFTSQIVFKFKGILMISPGNSGETLEIDNYRKIFK